MKFLLRFVLLLVCIMTGGEIYADKMPNNITIYIVSKNGYKVKLTPNSASDENLPVLPENLSSTDDLKVEATALEGAAITYSSSNDAILGLEEGTGEDTGKYYLKTGDADEAVNATITFTSKETDNYAQTSVSVTFLVDGRTVIEISDSKSATTKKVDNEDFYEDL
jgi:hypothetical protein